MNSNHITPSYPWYNPSRISTWRSTGEGEAVAQILIKNRPLLVATIFCVDFRTTESEVDEVVAAEVAEVVLDDISPKSTEPKELVAVAEENNVLDDVVLDDILPKSTESKELVAEESTTLDVIETFLKCDNLRIVADEKSDIKCNVTIEVELDEIDDLVTEELAEIYIAQGLIEEGKAIYIKLSLLNSEKSVYFAELIENLEKIE